MPSEVDARLKRMLVQRLEAELLPDGSNTVGENDNLSEVLARAIEAELFADENGTSGNTVSDDGAHRGSENSATDFKERLRRAAQAGNSTSGRH